MGLRGARWRTLLGEPDAGLVVAGIISEGAADSMRPLMSQLVPKVLQLALDPHPRVRYSALRCLVNFLKYVAPSAPVEEGGYDAEDAELDDQGGRPDISGMNGNLSEYKSGDNEPSFSGTLL